VSSAPETGRFAVWADYLKRGSEMRENDPSITVVDAPLPGEMTCVVRSDLRLIILSNALSRTGRDRWLRAAAAYINSSMQSASAGREAGPPPR
jgi:hypothetical protein